MYGFSKKLWKSLRSRIITMLKSKEKGEERTRLGNHARDVSMKRSLKRGQCCVKKKKSGATQNTVVAHAEVHRNSTCTLFFSLSPSPRLSSSELIADGFFSPQPLPNATHDSKTESRLYVRRCTVTRYLSVKLPLEYRRFFEKEREREREEKSNVKFRIRWVTYYKIPFLELRTFDSSNSAFHAFRPIFLQLCLQHRPIE